MATPFSRTLRSLEQDHHRRWLVGLAFMVVLIGGWAGWFFAARVAVYEVTERGRLDTGVTLVEAAVGGHVKSVAVKLGDRVEAGALLVELDATEKTLALDEQRTRLETLGAELDPLRGKLAAAEEGLGDSELAARGAVGEASALRRAASATAEQSARDAERLAALQQAGGATEAEQQRAALRAQAERSTAEAAGHAIARLQGERRITATDLRIQIQELRREVARVEGELRTGEATILRLEHEVRAHRITSPIAGVVGEIARIGVGTMMAAGERIASIVPQGKVRAVAEYRASVALGRIRAGQEAHVRLHGFSWLRYGTVRAQVTRVASEAQDGLVRVELDLKGDQGSSVPLEHGLPGDIEIIVERVSPFELVLRSVGKVFAGGREQAGEQTPASGAEAK